MLYFMAYTQTDLDSIKSAIARGVLTVRTGEDSITYASVDELIQVKNLIENELSLTATPNRQYPRHQIANFRD